MGSLVAPPIYHSVTMPSVTATFPMDATTDFIAYRMLARTTDPIAGAEVWVTTKTGTPGNLECVLAANVAAIPNVSGGVPVDVGGGSPTLASIANGSISNNARLTITFTNAFTPTAGTWYWLVLYPGAGGSGWSASHRYFFRQTLTDGSGFGSPYGEERVAISTDTGSAWTVVRGAPQVSWLTTGGVYLPTYSSCCLDDATSVDVDDTSNPDERGTACAVPANMSCLIHGLNPFLRSESATSDFAVACYSNDSQLESRAIDYSELESATAANLNAEILFLASQTVAAGATARVAVKSTDATQFLRHAIYAFGSQARRESALAFKDWWYCHRNGGAGAFTDDKTRIYSVPPILEFSGTGGGGQEFIWF